MTQVRSMAQAWSTLRPWSLQQYPNSLSYLFYLKEDPHRFYWPMAGTVLVLGGLLAFALLNAFAVFAAVLFRRMTGTWPINYGIAAEATVGKYGKIAKLPREVQISYAFACVFATFAASPAPIMEAAFGRLHKGGGLRPPPLWIPLWVLGRRQT